MHDIGDGLAAAGFSDPAIESELIELHYSSLKKLLTELKQLGSIKIWAEYPHLYKNKIFWEQLENYYRQHFSSDQQKLIATAELYYGIAFAPKQRQGIDAEVSIPISMISRKNT
jgi:malonyl-CoA O-methyltransferase